MSDSINSDKSTLSTLASPAEYRKAIAAFAAPFLGALTLSLSDGNLTFHEVIADVSVGLAGFVATFFTKNAT